jgi:tryptophanyl-tRNA synthetase
MTTPPSGPKRILSGVQPSGKLHLGNYFGAIRQHIALQDEGACFYFIADYHALTTIRETARKLSDESKQLVAPAQLLREYSRDVALDYLALGLDPDRAVFFRQSDVPEVTELAWILSTVTGMGLLERAVSYKEKVDKGIEASVGLFYYPVLMAADILIYRSNLVPVGKDQKQHVEMTRDIAVKFNQTYGETFVIPEPAIKEEVATVPGTDGQKMSKSYGNTIEIFGGEKAMRKQIMSIVMDSRTPQEPKPDADKNIVIQLLKLVAPTEAAADCELRLRAGGLGYGDLKKTFFEHYWNYFAAARARRAELLANRDYVEQVLCDGAHRARAVASQVLARARKVSGLGN